MDKLKKAKKYFKIAPVKLRGARNDLLQWSETLGFLGSLVLFYKNFEHAGDR